jgi:hypothetical protein
MVINTCAEDIAIYCTIRLACHFDEYLLDSTGILHFTGFQCPEIAFKVS